MKPGVSRRVSQQCEQHERPEHKRVLQLLLLLLLYQIIYWLLSVGLRKTTRNWRRKRMSKPRFQPAYLEQKSRDNTCFYL